jgi:hypothetical protein
VQEAIAPQLAAWESFYVIVGSSAGALTGLQFVVMALVADSERRSTMREVNAFGTPTVVHFCAALFVAAILSAPWHSLRSAGLGIGICGVAGVIYSLLIFRRARRQSGYKPVLEDWIWHTALPPLAYGSMAVAATVLRRHPEESLFVIAAATVLLTFIGIHNAWDTVTFIAVEQGNYKS